MPNSTIKKLISDDAKKNDGLNQKEREAIVDLLHYCMFADNFVALKEDQFVNSVAASLNWDKAISFESYEGGSIGNARRAKESTAYREEFLKGVSARLTSPKGRSLALDLCKKLYNADATLADAESTQLGVLSKLLK